MIKNQEIKFIDSNIVNVFHFLELKGQHNFLIGSNKIRNVLYGNDYDLNSNVKITDTLPMLKRLHQEFLSMFEKAYHNADYYILDFKCGVHNGEPIRWSYEDIRKGKILYDNRTFTFEECLLMDAEVNIIKLDICYIYNGIFTDINCLYNLFLVTEKEEFQKEKAVVARNVVPN
jgi:hypothetical protein